MKWLIKCTLPGLLLFFASTLAVAQNLDSLKTELQELKAQMQKVDELERIIAQIANDSSNIDFEKRREQQISTDSSGVLAIPKSDLRETNPAIAGTDLIADDFKGSWPMFGSEFRMKVGGYVKIDMLYDLDGTNDNSQFLMSTIPVEGSPEYGNHGYFHFIARETRFNIDVRRITPGAVPLRLFVEGDFWSSGNQFRLRHAYMVAGDFIIGQTWTTLSFLESLPFMIDFAAGDALFGGRAPQIRYQRNVNDALKLSAALELLPFIGIENPNDYAGKESLQYPLLALRADYKWKTGLLLLGTSVCQLYWDGGATGPSARTVQWDAVVAGRQYLNQKNFFTWNVTYGIGSGENIMAFAGSQANAVLNTNGELDAIPAFALVLGFVRNWNEKFTSNISYAYGWLDTPESRSATALKKGGIGHVNLIYRPVKQFSTGIEYMWGAQRTTDDALGRANRIQAMVKFDF